MKSVFLNKISQTVIVLVISLGSVNAQTKDDTYVPTDLYNEIKLQDSLLFAAFNSRDIDGFKKYFSEELEFYHDEGGLTGYEHTINFLKSTMNQKSDLERELVKGSLEVYPIPGFGAMEIGSHQFCHIENGKEQCGTFKFIHVWQKKEGEWKITRVISYGH